MSNNSLIKPDWPAPSNVGCFVSTRMGGSSCAPYDSFNLATHVGDEVESVLKNRKALPVQVESWLNQVHSNKVLRLPLSSEQDLTADASVTSVKGTACAVLTADCLPLLICSRGDSEIGAVHAGWKGLANGIIENTIHEMDSPADDLLVWMGPAIGPCHFEVGKELLNSFKDYEEAFLPGKSPGKYYMDIYKVAKLKLLNLGVSQVYGGQYCTFEESERFYSYRRDGITGRMASVIWMEE